MTPDPIFPAGLPRRLVATLAYAGWWVTGLIVWALERQDLYVRFHAAQSCIAFGTISGVVGGLAGMAAGSLVFRPKAFGFWLLLAGAAWVAGLILWIASMWAVATGRPWRIPVAARLAERVCRT
jgi:uncharacterized membrane protein